MAIWNTDHIKDGDEVEACYFSGGDCFNCFFTDECQLWHDLSIEPTYVRVKKNSDGSLSLL